jgi:hypothetical protein
MIPSMMRRRTLTPAEMAMHSGPFPTVGSRAPARIFAREIRTAEPFLRDLGSRLHTVAGLPSQLLWADQDIAFRGSVRQIWQRRLTDRTDHTLAGAGLSVRTTPARRPPRSSASGSTGAAGMLRPECGRRVGLGRDNSRTRRENGCEPCTSETCRLPRA